ncbi:TVP38/TMEM64 family protein [Legionella shakespearei]|uniref:TVP38/TMEM64 family membrane protein n=1 Tax=Legionella shakespearei DSM 23087 TaxID=1122169 RepID=A0A0W0YHT3_9GAMM|nr:TVP38/TMEM64 family protein [Legionella shakespearei]KTD56476.1 putative integral inner membrane protein [Legionella shakespearei DSM 23087]
MTYKVNYLIKILCFILALAVFIICAIAFQKHSLEIIHWIDDLGWLAPALFLIIYCMATLMLLPTMVLTLAGGAIFGPLLGTVLNLIGATFGAAVSFLITRHLIYDWFSSKKGERLDKLIAGVDQRGWMFVAFLRLFPIIPFNLVNYGMGITGIKFRLYLVTTFVFLIPAEIIYTYCGYAGLGALSEPGHLYRNGGIVLCVLAILFLGVVTLLKRK